MSNLTWQQSHCGVHWAGMLPHAPPGSQRAPIPAMSGISVEGQARAAGGSRQAVRAGHKISSLKPPVHSLLLVPCLLISSY